jgi:hypothetical protein
MRELRLLAEFADEMAGKRLGPSKPVTLKEKRRMV